MSTYTAIDKNTHVAYCYTPYQDYFFAKYDTTTPLLAAELSDTITHFPIAFINNSTTESFTLVTLNSLQPNFNLFVADSGKYLAPYVPSYYRAHPFKIVPNPENNNQPTLCFLQDSQLIHISAVPQSVAFFKEDGLPSKELTDIINFLQQRFNNETATQAVVDRLATLNLIIPWNINIKTDNNSNQEVKGIYKIDEEAIKALNPNDLSELTKSGAIGVAYAQLLSQNRINNISNLYKYHENNQVSANTNELDIDKIFGEADDAIKFY